MTWRDIQTSDDRDCYFYEQEKAAILMSEIARDIWRDPKAEQSWIAEANRHRTLRWPKDRQFQPVHCNAGKMNVEVARELNPEI